MRATRYVPTRWNLDHGFLALQSDTRLLLLGLWTWPETPTSGLTITDPGSIAKAIGISPRRAATCLAELAIAGFVEVDQDSSVLWLRGFWETQLGGKPNANHKAATRSQLRALPDTPMLRRFRAEYGLEEPMGIGESSREGSLMGSLEGSPMGGGMVLPSCPVTRPSHPHAGTKRRKPGQGGGRPS